MPTYEYKCDACGHDFEKFHSITAPPIRKCPACKKNKVRRLLSTGAGLIFKGSGFYITDYRSESYQSAAKSDTSNTSNTSNSSSNGESKPAATTDAKGDSKTESKSESKTESKPAAKSEKPPAARSSSAKRTSAKS